MSAKRITNMLDVALRPPLSIEEFTAGMAAVLEVQATNTNDDSLFGEAFDGCRAKNQVEPSASARWRARQLQALTSICPYYKQIIGLTARITGR